MAQLRILIVDDHTMFRDGLRMLLDHEDDLVVVGEAGGVGEAVRLAREQQPELVLMDLQLGRESGIEATRQILAEHPETKIIAVTMYQDDTVIGEMIQAGAQGYVLKDSGAAELLGAIRVVANGGMSISPDAARRFLAQYRRLAGEGPAPAGSLLGERDLQILRLLAQGKSNREIAATVCLSRHTLNKILSEIYAKMNVTNRTEAVALALSRGLIRRAE